MLTKYMMDIGPKSHTYPFTPGLDFRGLPFYLDTWGHFYAGKDYFTERCGLDRFLLFYTLSGRGLLKYRGTENILLPGQATVIHCEEYQYYRTLSEEPWEFKWLHFGGSSAREYFNLLNETSLKVVTVSDKENFHKWLEEIKATVCSKTVLADIQLAALLTNLMTLLLESKFNPLSSQYNNQVSCVHAAADYIHANYRSKLTIDDILKQVPMSKYHFVRTFKKYTGRTPYEYLLNYRINQSKALLRDVTLPVGEICEQVGYSNINNFIRDFRKYEGMTPSKYRKLGLG